MKCPPGFTPPDLWHTVRPGYGVIYCIMTPSGSKYIGQTRMAVRKRMNQHSSDARNGSEYPIHLAIRKYQGLKNLVIWVMAVCELELLDEREVRYIEELDTFRNGLNCTPGGEGGCTSESAKKAWDGRRTGYVYQKASGRWTAHVCGVNLGTFDTEEEARAAIQEWLEVEEGEERDAVETKYRIKGATSPTYCLSLRPSGRYIVCINGVYYGTYELEEAVRVRDHLLKLTGAERAQWNKERKERNASELHHLKLLPNGRYMVLIKNKSHGCYDLPDAKQVRDYVIPLPEEHEEPRRKKRLADLKERRKEEARDKRCKQN